MEQTMEAGRVPEHWTMGCKTCGAEAASPADGSMPEGWGFTWSGLDDGWNYACPNCKEVEHG